MLEKSTKAKHRYNLNVEEAAYVMAASRFCRDFDDQMSNGFRRFFQLIDAQTCRFSHG